MFFFTKDEERRVVAAIAEAERGSIGEVRVHLAERATADIFRAARTVFFELGMHKTEDRCGVLVFIVPTERRFYVLGDKGIHAVVPKGFWDEVRNVMQDGFRRGNAAEGIADGLGIISRYFKSHFPLGDRPAKNELPDDISYG